MLFFLKKKIAKQLMSISGGYLGRRLASEWCIGSSRAAINIILPLLLLLYVLKKILKT